MVTFLVFGLSGSLGVTPKNLSDSVGSGALDLEEDPAFLLRPCSSPPLTVSKRIHFSHYTRFLHVRIYVYVE